ncbi:hypothetical protein ABPG74_017845 [Tetrahymena malaccensis]
MNATSYSNKSGQGGFGRKSQTKEYQNMDNIGYTSGTLSVANGTQQLGQNPASLKGKLQNLEETTKAVSDELSMHKKELQILKSEKDTLQQVLKVKTDDVQNTLTNELKRLEDEMRRHFNHQKAETHRIQTQINTLKAEKTSLAQTLNGLEHRIQDLEMNVGNHEHF